MRETRKKVGLISCSGEEIPLGTLSRTAVRLVLEKLRPDRTVTICLPLFLAGEAGERSFAKTFPTLAVDGCSKLCAKTGTERYSGKVDDVLDIEELLRGWGENPPLSRRALTDQEWKLAWRVAEEIASRVDVLYEKSASRESPAPPEEEAAGEPVCSCMLGAPKKTPVRVGSETVELLAVEPVFRLVRELPELTPAERAKELVRQVKLYNGPLDEVPEEALGAALIELLQAGATRKEDR